MNKEAIELVKQYIIATTSGDNTISKDAYDLLTHMLQADRSLASEMYDIYDKIESNGTRYQIPSQYSDDESNDEGYEH